MTDIEDKVKLYEGYNIDLKILNIVDDWYHEQTRFHLVDIGDPMPMVERLHDLLRDKQLSKEITA